MTIRHSEDLTQALAWSLEAVQDRGLSPEACLERYPQHREELEPLLRLALELRQAPQVEPSPAFARHARARLLSRLPPRGLAPWLRFRRRIVPLLSWRPRLGWAVTAVLLALVFLVGATGLAYAADGASPGDALYGIDRAVESLQMALAPNPETRARLALAHAEERLLEAQVLIARAAGEEEIQEAVEAYSESIRQAAQALAEVAAAGQRASAEDLLTLLETTLSAHEQVLAQLAAQAPEQAWPALERALKEARRERSSLERFLPISPPGPAEPPHPELPGGRPGPPGDGPGGTPDEGGNRRIPFDETPGVIPPTLASPEWVPTELPEGEEGWSP